VILRRHASARVRASTEGRVVPFMPAVSAGRPFDRVTGLTRP
jgi:hypothetical protein